MFITDQSIRSVSDLSPAFQREFMSVLLNYDCVSAALVFVLGA